ncbi:MAG: hypothetical protein ACLFPW_06985 [Spirochaetaceae bacterium]
MAGETAERALIDKGRTFLGLAPEAARNALGGAPQEVMGDAYGSMRYLTSLEAENIFPGTLYLEGDQVRLVRLHHHGLEGITRSELSSWIGGEPTMLRSRAGKRAQLLVYASKGIAFSCQGEHLDFLELFNPCTQAEYETRYYRPPAQFVR